MHSNAADNGTRHLALVFFDILYLDSESLVHRPYAERRVILERTVRLRKGYAMLADRVPVDLRSFESGVRQLESAFSKLLADHQEGAILKAEESRHCDWIMRWIKVKHHTPFILMTIDVHVALSSSKRIISLATVPVIHSEALSAY